MKLKTLLKLEENKGFAFTPEIVNRGPHVQKAVEQLFNVQVESVTTATQKGKTKRNKFGIYKRSNFKKAFVSLKEGSEIQFEGIN